MSTSPGNTDGSDPRIYKVAIVAPTCFYYQVPLFRALAAHARIELMVYFCSDEALRGTDVPAKYQSKGDWGIEEDLLEGYAHKFLRNYSPIPSYLRVGVGLINFGIWREIRNSKPDAVVLMSWMNPTWWLAALACWYSKIPLLFLTDQNVQRDLAGLRPKIWAKRLVLGRFLFPASAGFLCAGTSNRQFYRYHGVPENKMVPFAFSWGYGSLIQGSGGLNAHKKQARAQLGIDENKSVILFCGRLSEEKNALLLLQAYEKIDSSNSALIFVGDGKLKPALEDYAANHKLDSVRFLGFQNRRNISRYYSVADFLILPSRRETWGIVVNEALCFGLPVITSDQVGASQDLVVHGYNGFQFPSGDAAALAGYIEQLVGLSQEERSAMGDRSRDIIRKWSQRDLGESITHYLDLICDGNTAA